MCPPFDLVAATLTDRGSKAQRLSGGRLMFQCPTHADTTPSLCVTPSADRVLVHCFAGCATGDVLAALGLAFRDLFARESR